MKRILSKLDLTQYSDGWVLMRDGEPNSIFDTEEDARNAFYWSGRGDYEYDLGAHDYEVKRWEGGKLIDASQSVDAAAKSVAIPLRYSKYFQLYDEPADSEYIEDIQSILDDYDLKYVADVVAKDEYADLLSDEGLDTGTLAEDGEGNLGVYWISHGGVYDLLSMISTVVDDEDFFE